MKKILLLTSTTVLLLATPHTSVIFMIGDGMGPAYTSSYRYYSDDNTDNGITATVFDTMLVGMNTTYSKNSVITDSAAAATALATGYKTDNGYIGVVRAKQHTHQTLLEYAKEEGYVTAMAVTSTLTHATPAAFISRVHHRDNETKIAKDFFIKNQQGKLKFDFLIGAGEKYFIEGYTDFNQTAKENHVKLYREGYNLDTIKEYPFIAFTAYGDYPAFAIDEKEEDRYRVSKITKKSLELVNNKPFFLMVESSQIDWCGHINDISCAMAEMEDFARSVTLAKSYVDTHPNTLLLITADHSTGGLAIGKKIKKDDTSMSDEVRSRSYIWYKEVIEKIKASSINIAQKIRENKEVNNTFQKYTSITLNNEEYLSLKTTFVQKQKKSRKAVTNIINQHSNTGWTTHGHTAVDVETFAYGKGSEKFRGLLDNTQIAEKIFEVLGEKR